MKLCQFIRVKISSNDIIDIFRDGRNIIVEFRSMPVKESVMGSNRHTVRASDLLKDLKESFKSSRVYISHYRLKFFSDMVYITKNAISNGILYKYFYTEDGLAVQRTSKSTRKIFMSKEKLIDYIDQIKGKTMKNTPKWSEPEHYY